MARGGIRPEAGAEIQTLCSEYLAATRRASERPGSNYNSISREEAAKAAVIIRRIRQILQMDI